MHLICKLLGRKIKLSKFHVPVDLSTTDFISTNYLVLDGESYHVSDDIINSIYRQVGISAGLVNFLSKNAPDMLRDLVLRLYSNLHDCKIILLVSSEEKSVLGFSTATQIPLLNSEFSHSIDSFFEMSDGLEVVGTDDVEDTTSSRLVFRKDSFNINEREYKLGVLFRNDELDSMTCRLVVLTEGITFYLPTKYYNLSTARYSRSTSNSLDAAKIIYLRVLEDMMSDTWQNKLLDVAMSIDASMKIKLSYEEYSQVLRVVKSSALLSGIEDEELSDLISDIASRVDDFEMNYPQLSEKSHSYIWRCSALSDNCIFDMITAVNDILSKYYLYPQYLSDVKILLGDLLMNDRIMTYLAKRRGSSLE